MEFLPLTVQDASVCAQLEREYIECPWSEKTIIDSLSLDAYIFVKAVQNGELVGYGGAQLVIDELNICNVAVFERFRHKGAASGILNTIVATGKARGAKRAFLEVNSSNVAALSLYRKLGFEQISVRKNYYASGDAIVMRLTIEEG
jgi:ribosomal-protein-alanine N-acetyltransferase